MSIRPSRTARLGRIALLLLCGWALGGGLAATLVASHAALAASEAAPQKLWAYVATYTGKSKGIYLCELGLGSGELTLQGLAATTVNPSFLAIDPTHRFLYAVNEVDHVAGSKSATVSSFAINPQTGALTFLNQQSSRGTTPAHLTVDREGKNVLVANYGSGSVAVLPIGPGGLLAPATGFVQHHGSSVNKSRQEGPHAHCVAVDPANRLAFVADLGLDQVLIYQFDATQGLLVPNAPPFAAVAPGSGPRHFAFHPSGRTAYVINELFSTITTFGYDPGTGALQTLQTVSTLPPGFKKTNTAAEVQVHRDRPRHGTADPHRLRAHRGQDPAQFQRRSNGSLPPGRQSGQWHGGRLQNRSADRWSHPHRSHGGHLDARLLRDDAGAGIRVRDR